jgi:Protein of unknown function (DUF2585)
MKRWTNAAAVVVALLVLQIAAELWMGRLPFGPDGHFGWWTGNIWSSAQSQRFADPYSFTHIVHGLLFYLLLWLVARRVSLRGRYLTAVVVEVAWEILENSPIIIDRYRAVTIALGYVGDSVLNSVSDVLAMSIGFLVAARFRPAISIGLAAAIELGLLLAVRDNLTLNIVMLVHPIEAIRQWQMAAQH